MRTGFVAFIGFLISVTSLAEVGQAPHPAPVFEAVSIRRRAPERPRPFEPPSSYRVQQRPDGGVTITDGPVANLIAIAYPLTLPKEIVGLPEWARSDRYDVSATSSLSSATTEDRIAMMRSMLADRFKLAVHVEKREQPVFDLVMARRDRRFGAGLTLAGSACPVKAAVGDGSTEEPASPLPWPDLKKPPPPCTFRTVGAVVRDRLGDGQGKLGDLLEGEGTMAALAQALRLSAGRPVVDKTGLTGTYRVVMNFAMSAQLRGPSITPSQEAAPSVFTAVEQQLGLRLRASRQLRDTLVVDHLERPTEN